MKTKCYSVRLMSMTLISHLCYKAVAFDGSEALIPRSQVFGQDYHVQKSNSFWISEWILRQKYLQYSCKKVGWYNSKTATVEPNIVVEHHKPAKVFFDPKSLPDGKLIK